MGERGGSAGRGTKGLFSNIWLWRAVAGVLTAAVILISCIHFVKPSLAKEFPVCPSLDLCPSGWLYFQRKCYYLSENEAAWNSSQSSCSSHNASLLVIENHQELSFMMKITKQDPWIGLYKRNEGFFWVNGKALNNELFEVKGSGSCAYLESKGVSASGCYLTRKWHESRRICQKTTNCQLHGEGCALFQRFNHVCSEGVKQEVGSTHTAWLVWPQLPGG
ncbi:C-type lectin domain family 2 member B-like isoform X2 [Vidua macroura]|uniref:C-type lectin domain family 2 member B-like isoform X2 n=1 Tax=Vidua macroura TaxID=187451 RepID=UPI0023A8E708|nr:C-type lectin domain family 2 member B-like isoform X2 [Vidua macroura]